MIPRVRLVTIDSVLNILVSVDSLHVMPSVYMPSNRERRLSLTRNGKPFGGRAGGCGTLLHGRPAAKALVAAVSPF